MTVQFQFPHFTNKYTYISTTECLNTRPTYTNLPAYNLNQNIRGQTLAPRKINTDISLSNCIKCDFIVRGMNLHDHILGIAVVNCIMFI